MNPAQPRTHHLADASPEFLTAVDELMRTAEALGHEHPQAKRAMQRVMVLSPPSLMDFMGREAQAMGLIPEADGYTEDGAPVFSLEAIAAKLGMSMEEAQEAMDTAQADRAELGLPGVLVDPARVHRKQ